jgi:hypothetical protein
LNNLICSKDQQRDAKFERKSKRGKTNGLKLLIELKKFFDTLSENSEEDGQGNSLEQDLEDYKDIVLKIKFYYRKTG